MRLIIIVAQHLEILITSNINHVFRVCFLLHSLMAASQTTGVTTRQMLKRRESMLANGNRDIAAKNNLVVFTAKKSGGKQSKDCNKEDSLDESGLKPLVKDAGNVSVVSDFNCRTFPLQHGDQPWMADSMCKRQPKTETASKQVRTIYRIRHYAS